MEIRGGLARGWPAPLETSMTPRARLLQLFLPYLPSPADLIRYPLILEVCDGEGRLLFSLTFFREEVAAAQRSEKTAMFDQS
jgi:hypothetical protein